MTFAGVYTFWDAIGHTRPACVIAEVELPDGDGIELYVQLTARHPDLPFALLLSRETGTALHRARTQGIQAVYQKPLLVDQLRLFVEAACSRL
jgi:DNA-binding NtrC family response regulator